MPIVLNVTLSHAIQCQKVVLYDCWNGDSCGGAGALPVGDIWH